MGSGSTVVTDTQVLDTRGVPVPKVLDCSAGCVVGCPPMPEGYSVAIRQAGASQASVEAIDGAQIVPGSELKTAQQYASISLLSTVWGTFSIYGQTAA